MTSLKMTTLDDKIVRKRKELRKLCEGARNERESHHKKAADLESKKEALKAKMRSVIKKGVDLTVFSQIMQEANAKAYEGAGPPDYYSSLTFSHEVLLLNTVHVMEVHEQLLWHSIDEGKKLAKFVERRKIALREQNTEYEIETVSKLTMQYATMKKLEADYREAIRAQQTYISKMEWKTSGILLPMPTLEATTSEFISDQRGHIFVSSPPPNRGLENSVSRVTAEWARSMKNIMEMDGAFPAPPDDDDLIPSINRGRAAATDHNYEDYDDDLDRPPVDFVAVLRDDNANSADSDRQPPRRVSRQGRRMVRSDSIDTMSTAGEELLQGIQDFFFRGRGETASKRGGSANSFGDQLSLDESAKDWASAHGKDIDQSKSYGLSLPT